ncbi:MAG: hypothetical protein Q4B44_06655, partial [Erysipelotrichaceae bacterium]|nr:hypothetical protein [Erysipelotrichaceae bacterium]
MKLKKILAALLACACMTACDAPASGEEPEKTQEPSADTVNIARYYSDLDKENHFEAIPKEKVTSILNHGTAVLVFSFPECPWCQAYIPLLEEALVKEGAEIRKNCMALSLLKQDGTICGALCCCMMGWDWGPRLPDMGIWKDVYLLEKDSA